MARSATLDMLARARSGEEHGASIEDLEAALALLDGGLVPDFVDLD